MYSFRYPTIHLKQILNTKALVDVAVAADPDVQMLTLGRIRYVVPKGNKCLT